MWTIITIMKIILDSQEQEVVARMGASLRMARIKKEQTQEELGARIGVTRWTVAAMENGDHKVSIGVWLKASALLDLLETWNEVLQKQEDPFSRYDREQAANDQLRKARTRIRKKNAPPIG